MVRKSDNKELNNEAVYITSVSGPYKHKNGKYQVLIRYSDTHQRAKNYTTEEIAKIEIEKLKAKIEAEREKRIATLPDYPEYDENNPVKWWRNILALVAQRLLITKDANLRQDLRAISQGAGAVSKLQNIDEMKEQLEALKEQVNSIISTKGKMNN